MLAVFQFLCLPRQLQSRFFLPSFRGIIIIPSRAICSVETQRNQSESKDVVSRFLLNSDGIKFSDSPFPAGTRAAFFFIYFPYSCRNFIYDGMEPCLRQLLTCQRAHPAALR